MSTTCSLKADMPKRQFEEVATVAERRGSDLFREEALALQSLHLTISNTSTSTGIHTSGVPCLRNPGIKIVSYRTST
eukprot:scaffold122500_cov14-Prasinocladus_malaysianus.AAC.1